MLIVKEILEFLDGKDISYIFNGDKDLQIVVFSSLQDLKENSICWVKAKKNLSDDILVKLHKKNVLVVCPFKIDGVSCIITDYPKGIFFSILNRFFAKSYKHSISEKAIVLSDRIGENVHISPNCYIGEEVQIGDNTILHPNVVIDCPCIIGKNCEIHSGAVIGTDVEGYYIEKDVPIKETHYMGVEIGDNVEIGANTTIAKGLLVNTYIGNNVKIWDLCHIGHNSIIEDNCIIIVGSYICGSAKVKKNSYLAPASVVLNQVTLGERVTVGVNSVAMSDINDNATIMGTPGVEFLPKAFRKKLKGNK